MPGILISYQGIFARRATFRRSRGYGADISQVLIPAGRFPKDFKWELPNRLVTRVRPKSADLAAIISELVGPGQPLPTGLKHEGTLIMAVVTPAGEERVVTVPHMIVIRIDTDQSDDVGSLTWLMLTLVDERFFWPRGVMKRWSFNRVRADGTVALDSVGVDGKLITRADILTVDVAPALFRGMTLAAVPERWGNETRELNLPPFPSANVTLATMLKESSLEDPCLHIDGKLAIHEAGDGMVGWADGGKGVNKKEFPPDVFLDNLGTGQGHSTDALYPEDFYLVIADRPTVATVVLDDAEPVVIIRGQPFLLSEEFVRDSTGGRFGLEWLKAFVMLPSAEQARVDLTEDVATGFRTQAFRRSRIPGVEKIEKGFYVGSAGKNAHLLPLLARAETQGGRRLPVVVETYRWVTRRKELATTSAALFDAAIVLQDAAKRVAFLATSPKQAGGFVPNPLNINPNLTEEFADSRSRFEQFATDVTGSISLNDFFRAAKRPEARARFDSTALSASLTAARRISLIKTRLSPDAAATYQAAYVNRLGVLDDVNGTALQAHFKLAQTFVETQLKAKERGETGSDFEGELQAAIKEAVNTIERAKRDKDRRARTGQAPGKLTGAVVLKNLPRSEDPAGRVQSAELGVVSHSLSGHAVEPDVPAPSATDLRPCPVRIIFGAKLRPRLDVTLAQAGRPTTGTPGSPAAGGTCPGGDSKVPKILTDRESHFVATFRRVGRGKVERVDIKDVPLDQVMRIPINKARLLPLSGDGNLIALEREAAGLARAKSAIPKFVSAKTHSLADPWSVQCDGVVAAIEIRTEFVDGVPAGFTTDIHTGTNPPVLAEAMRTVPHNQATQEELDAINNSREAYGIGE